MNGAITGVVLFAPGFGSFGPLVGGTASGLPSPLTAGLLIGFVGSLTTIG